jgi:hypothetical protein
MMTVEVIVLANAAKEPDMVTAVMLGLTATMVGVVGVGVGALARRGGAAGPKARRQALGVVSAVALWLSLTAALAQSGLLANWQARPPPLLLVPLAAFVAMVIVVRRPGFRELLTHLPPHWPLAAQTFRVLVELVLLELFLEGRAPKQVTMEGHNLDVLVGLAAPAMALLVARGRASSRAIVAWNVAGLAVLANTIFTVVTSFPGPLQLGWPGEPFTAPASWPMVWLPAFLAPLAVLLHVASLRQALTVPAARPAHQGT